MTPTDTVLEFITAINEHHIDKLVGLMTPDHRFTDSLGKVIPGRRHMRDAWMGYFKRVPDYSIQVEQTFTSGDTVVAVGTAGGTVVHDGPKLPEDHWFLPAAWKGVVKDHRVAEWHAFVDHEPLRKAIKRTTPAAK